VAHLAWRAQPPDEPAEERPEETDEEAEVVDLGRQRLLGWLRGMFGGSPKPDRPPPDED
jgi:hypothetical protein